MSKADFDLPSPAQPKTQEVMDGALNYRDWIFDQVRPHLGRRVLEVGAGRGTLTDCVVDRDAVVALELDEDFVASLRQRFGGLTNVEVLAGSATDSGVVGQAAGKVDSAMSFNVLEHITDDTQVMRNVFDILPPGGRFACFVPAFPSIFGTMDRGVGHVRRYTRAEMRAKMTAAGFRVVEVRYMNFIGFFAWFVSGRILRFNGVGAAGKSVGLYDRAVIPVCRLLEKRWRPPFGQSLVGIGERPA
jgi:SAM-dependent methyltransferase